MLADIIRAILSWLFDSSAGGNDIKESGTLELPATDVVEARNRVREALGILLLVTMLSSCTIGIRREVVIVYASIAKTPDNVQALPRIATNERIRVTIAGEQTTIDAGGFFIISAQDLTALLPDNQ
jgi:hypothetical protein